MRFYHDRRFFNWRNNILLIITAVILVAFGIRVYFDDLNEQKVAEQFLASEQERHKQQVSEMYEREKMEAADSFYQKLADGFDVNILVVGDSIGVGGKKKWANLVSAEIQKNYHIKTHMTNISMGGNSSYAGYVRTGTLDDGIDYDLVVICYGQNDKEQDFGLYYEALIRSIKNKYPKASIIAILESSQKEYTSKMKTIQELAAHYNIPVADTIAPFMANYDSLVKDTVHPNDKGHQVYCDTIMDIIKPLADERRGVDSSDISVVDSRVAVFDNFKWIGLEQFTRKGNKFVLNTSLKGSVLGIDYSFVPGKNNCQIEIDGKIYVAPQVSFSYDKSQRHIMIINNWDSGETVNIKNNISVIFTEDDAGKAQADLFSGIALSYTRM